MAHKPEPEQAGVNEGKAVPVGVPLLRTPIAGNWVSPLSCTSRCSPLTSYSTYVKPLVLSALANLQNPSSPGKTICCCSSMETLSAAKTSLYPFNSAQCQKFRDLLGLLQGFSLSLSMAGVCLGSFRDFAFIYVFQSCHDMVRGLVWSEPTLG